MKKNVLRVHDGWATVPLAMLVGLASAVIHAQEYLSSGEPIDSAAMDDALAVAAPLMKKLQKLAMLPVKRW